MRNIKTFVGCVGLVVSACTTIPDTLKSDKTLPVLDSAPLCENASAKISISYPTARINNCRVQSSNKFEFTITPENTPINNSAWFGFRVDPKSSSTLRATIKYKDGTHRYQPKISYDGVKWELLPSSRVDMKNKSEVELRLPLSNRPFLVSAQEILTKDAHDNWSRQMSAKPFVSMSQIGQSVDDNPISMLTVETQKDIKKPYVILVGRQHPPELTGALALMPFAETVLGDSPLADEFRKKFNLLIVPNLNPDGVTAGNWRHNKNGKDLNRDWGPFTEPETQSVKSELDKLDRSGDKVMFFLDFHSTRENVLYTQTDDEPTKPANFAHNWVTAVDDRLDDAVYPFTRKPSPNTGRPVSKNYMYDRYGIPAITYEVGDHTNRKALSDAAVVFAEEMMSLLIKELDKS